MHLSPSCKTLRSSNAFFLLLLLLLLFLLSAVPSTLAQRFICHGPVHAYDPNYPVPSVSDCQHLLSHLPRVNENYNSSSAGQRLISRSHPFQPQAHFTHGTCRLAVTLSAPPSPPYLTDGEPIPAEGVVQAIWEFLKRDDLNTLPDPLPEFTVADIWAGVRRLGGELLETCIEEQQQAGMVVGRLGDRMPGSWYFITIGTLGDVTSVLDNRVTARARASLHDLLLPDFQGQPLYVFELPSYQV